MYGAFVRTLYIWHFTLDSPYKMKVKKKSEPKNVKVTGIEKEVKASLPTEFMIDTKNAGFGQLNVSITVMMHYWFVSRVS